jgi:hypothetical protein
VSFTPEADAAVTARTALDPDFRRVIHNQRIIGAPGGAPVQLPTKTRISRR